jgi:hypothetical protein
MAWDSEQPQQPWHRAFAGIKLLPDDVFDLAKICEPIPEWDGLSDEEIVFNIPMCAMKDIAARINELSAIVAQNALTAIPETEEPE